MAYTTTATTKGGRDGRAVLDESKLALAAWRCRRISAARAKVIIRSSFSRLAGPRCFGQAILVLAKKHGLDGQAAKVTCKVTLNTDGGFSLAADLHRCASRCRQGRATGPRRGSTSDLSLFKGDAREHSRDAIDRLIFLAGEENGKQGW